jgi:hypothetical protein
MADKKNYNSCTPYNEMVKDVYKRDFSNPCPTISEIDWSKRIVNLDKEPRPDYYGGKDNTYEVFNVLEAWGLDQDFYLGNVIKYLARAGKKTSNKKEDLQKALVYLQRRIDKL